MVYSLDPLTDERWAALARSHADASVFHSPAWLRALQQTYGYEPVVLTTTPPGEAALRNGLVFCRVNSWLTGGRLVSLPFSDHCEPLLEDPSELHDLLSSAEAKLQDERLKYLELRPIRPLSQNLLPAYERSSFVFHQLDLTPSVDTLFGNLHAASIQRKIRRAEREGLTYTEGRSAADLEHFYSLTLRTRIRHGIPPQPKEWFQNLAATFGDALKIRTASHRNRPVAAILTLKNATTLVYKYGCSDQAQHNLGGMQMLMWRAIQGAKQERLSTLDLGRSDANNEGLVIYKDRWGAPRSTLTYLRRLRRPRATIGSTSTGAESWKRRLAGQVFSYTPASIVVYAGRFLYRHLG